ncbi:MAG: HAMP domain-containing histidine kinase [Hyphomicrobiaceae bacterium]|nr:HAMP domain-containing histidine kinase [Hyphomicrobiaceae bacterium]
MLAHFSGLGFIAPFLADDPIVAVPVIIGLAVTCLTLTRSHQIPSVEADNDDTATASDRQTAQFVPAMPPPSSQPASAHHLMQQTPRHVEINANLRADLMSRVSHELRTPLNAVMGFSDLMGHQMFGPLGHPRYEEYVTHIRESSQKLLKSAEDTLAVTSLMAKSANQNDREPLSLASLVNDARKAIGTDASHRRITIQTDIASDVEVIAHRRALRQALVNVICEAIERAAEGATVSLRATIDIDKVAFMASVDTTMPAKQEEHRSLPICLARTLLELDGNRLIENPYPAAPWSVLLSLEAATQTDFFTHANAIH